MYTIYKILVAFHKKRHTKEGKSSEKESSHWSSPNRLSVGGSLNGDLAESYPDSLLLGLNNDLEKESEEEHKLDTSCRTFSGALHGDKESVMITSGTVASSCSDGNMTVGELHSFVYT